MVNYGRATPYPQWLQARLCHIAGTDPKQTSANGCANSIELTPVQQAGLTRRPVPRTGGRPLRAIRDPRPKHRSSSQRDWLAHVVGPRRAEAPEGASARDLRAPRCGRAILRVVNHEAALRDVVRAGPARVLNRRVRKAQGFERQHAL